MDPPNPDPTADDRAPEQAETLRPGFASEEEAKAEPPTPPSLAVAHYAEMTAAEAEAVWESETLCVTCLHNTVCRVAPETEGPRIVVARCLAYLPGGG